MHKLVYVIVHNWAEVQETPGYVIVQGEEYPYIYPSLSLSLSLSFFLASKRHPASNSNKADSHKSRAYEAEQDPMEFDFQQWQKM